MNCPCCESGVLEATQDGRQLQCPRCGECQPLTETSDGVCLVGKPVGINCTRCGSPLEQALIEGQPAFYCVACHGFLAQTIEFSTIVTRRRARQLAADRTARPINPTELHEELKCPACLERMETHPYHAGGNVVVDSCIGCNVIWLDGEELNVIGRYIPHVRAVEPPLNLNSASPIDGSIRRRAGEGLFWGWDGLDDDNTW